MFQVQNRGCIRRLSDKSLKAAKTRNRIAVLAIALTTILFTSLFTIAASINYSFQQQNFRQAGGDMHGSFKDVTEEQMEELRHDPLVKESGARLLVGMTSSDPPFNKSHVDVYKRQVVRTAKTMPTFLPTLTSFSSEASLFMNSL